MKENFDISNRAMAVIVITLCLLVVLFEASQQYFYVTTYNLSNNTTFMDLFFSQTRKWLIWLLSLFPLFIFTSRIAKKDQIKITDLIGHFFLTVSLLLIVLTIISVIEVLIGNNPLTMITLWNYYLFFIFQKSPIYMLGYLILSVVFYLYIKNLELEFQVLEFQQLKAKDKVSFLSDGAKLPENQSISVLKIKVGNSYKIINIDNIEWFEADDYCVNVYINDYDQPYSMRASLKSLEKLLPASFVRVHRSAIVNMNVVREISTNGTGVVKLNTGDEVVVAKSKLKVVNDYFSHLNLGNFH